MMEVLRSLSTGRVGVWVHDVKRASGLKLEAPRVRGRWVVPAIVHN